MFDPFRFRHALGRFATGVTVITARYEDRTHGMTASTFTSVSLDPPLIFVSLDNRSLMHRILPITRRYGASVLTENQEHLSNHFAGRSNGGLQVRFMQQNGVPLLEGAVAHFVVEVIDVHPAGDHTLYISRVEFFQARDDRPLLFYGGQYQQLRADKIKTANALRTNPRKSRSVPSTVGRLSRHD
ncbi:MAG: flavin reductase family protein [Candidatus Acidiferrales bacterium]